LVVGGFCDVFGTGEGGVDQMAWFVVVVKPRHEKSVSKNFEIKGIESLVPMTLARRKWSDRTKEVELPLFPGYVFCTFDPTLRVTVLNTPGVFEIVRIGRELAAVDPHEIAALQRLVQSGLMAEPWPRIEVGERVEIAHGPLAGCKGVLNDIKTRVRLVLSVTLLNRAVSVEIDRECVEPDVNTRFHSRSVAASVTV
jgi:transcription antitermination factor NusG